MRVRIAFTADVDLEGRKLIAAYYGLTGAASHVWVERFFRRHGESGWLVLQDQADIEERSTA